MSMGGNQVSSAFLKKPAEFLTVKSDTSGLSGGVGEGNLGQWRDRKVLPVIGFCWCVL